METNTGYKKSYYFQNLYKQMQKDFHYTSKQMHKNFPWINKLIVDELLQNIEIENQFEITRQRKGYADEKQYYIFDR